jgi:carbamoyl-phosphate synthase large subunit
MDLLTTARAAKRGAPATAGGKLTMLITSAGRRVALMRSFRHAAEGLGVNLEVLACDLQPDWSSACQLADRAFAVPRVDDPSYVATLRALCGKYGVGLVVPTIDPELAPLSAARAAFAAAGTYVAVSDPDVIAIAGDKLATANTLAACGIPTPVSTSLPVAAEALESWVWPAIVKPRYGSAGRGIRIVGSAADLAGDDAEPMMIQELLTGEECTVNIFVSRDGVLRAVVPHRRLAVRAGEVEKGITDRVAVLDMIARRLTSCLRGVRGALCFQAMVSPDGTASVFEINARFGGGYPLADHAGASFARWLIEEQCGLASSACNDWKSGVTMLRFDDAVFR